MILAIGIENAVVAAVVEMNYIHWILVDDDLMMMMIMNIDFDKVVEYWWMKVLVHENYFDVVTEENLLVVIQTKIKFQNFDHIISFLFTFFSICICEDDASADAIVNPRILSKCDDDELKEFVC
jgi:hypothetical protein